MNSRYKRGWFNESHRHYLAAKGISTKRYNAIKWKTSHVKKQGGHVEYMSPEEYLELIGDDTGEEGYYDREQNKYMWDSDIGRVSVEDWAKKADKGEIEVTPPEWWKTQYGGDTQEGRHRAIAAKLLGVEKIPVVVSQPQDRLSDEVREEFIKIIHAVGGYDNEWRRRFASGSPGVYMDEDHLKLYAEILKKHGVTDYPEEWDEGELHPRWVEELKEGEDE